MASFTLMAFQQSISVFFELAGQEFAFFIFISKKTNECITHLKLTGWFFFFPGENATFSLTNSSKSSLCFREWDRERQKESFHWNMFYVAGFFSLRNIWHQYRLAELRHTVLHCTAAISKLTNSTHSAAIEARRFIRPPPPLFPPRDSGWGWVRLYVCGIAGVQWLVCRPSSLLPNKQMWL